MMRYQHDIEACLDVLERGGLILYPTDTLWAIGCDAQDERAVDRIHRIKGKKTDNNMIILVADEAAILRHTRQKNLQIYDYIKGIHKPVSVIYSEGINLAPNLLHEDRSIGIRVVKDDFCQLLIRSFGRAIVSASSNLSGYPPPRYFNDIELHLRDAVDYVVQHRQDDDEPGIPSTVIRLKDDGDYEMIRP